MPNHYKDDKNGLKKKGKQPVVQAGMGLGLLKKPKLLQTKYGTINRNERRVLDQIDKDPQY
jgi:hypothetical protein